MDRAPDSTISSKRRLKFSLGLGFVALLVVGLVIYAMSRPGSTAFYMTTTEVAALGPAPATKDYRVNGKVVPGSVEQDGLDTTFTLTDGKTEIVVTTSDPLPDTFRDRSEVVARGDFDGETFAATEVLAKCPSKFKAKA
jgi:cytochrome c-type biogenesis protein CcmE